MLYSAQNRQIHLPGYSDTPKVPLLRLHKGFQPLHHFPNQNGEQRADHTVQNPIKGVVLRYHRECGECRDGHSVLRYLK